MEWERDGFVVSTDRERIDVSFVHRFLRDESYWARGIPPDVVERSLDNSIPFGLYEENDMRGFARVVTDSAVVAYLGDVFVTGERRGRGLGRWLVECAVGHPDLAGIRTFLLGTDDAHDFYRGFGFATADPARWMVRGRDPRELYGE